MAIGKVLWIISNDYIIRCCIPWAEALVIGQPRLRFKRCRAGAVVGALASSSQHCCLGSIPRLGVMYGLSLLIFYSAPRGFSRVFRFSPLLKYQNLIRFVIICWFQFTVPPISAPAFNFLSFPFFPFNFFACFYRKPSAWAFASFRFHPKELSKRTEGVSTDGWLPAIVFDNR